MFFKNILVYAEEGWIQQTLFVDIPSVNVQYNPATLPPPSFVDLKSQYLVIPGLMDTHIHGLFNNDFSDGTLTAYRTITELLGKHGVAYCSATFVSMELEQLKNALRELNTFLSLPVVKGAAQIVSVHLEGPFIARNCKGAHDEKVLQDKISLGRFLEIIAAAPRVKDWKITLDPELPGALEFIEQTRHLVVNGQKIGVHIFIGHSNAQQNILQEASRRGVAGYTHLGNANCERLHREKDGHAIANCQSNVVRFALQQNKPVELIVDGQHLSSEFVQFVQRERPNQTLLVSDALRTAGMPDGEYTLGSLAVLKIGNKIVLKDTPEKLAGSAALLPELIVNYLAILKKSGLVEKDCLNALYHALVTNPRNSSMQNPKALNNNFVILDRSTGELILSQTNGKVWQHKSFNFNSKQTLPDQFFSTHPKDQKTVINPDLLASLYPS